MSWKARPDWPGSIDLLRSLISLLRFFCISSSSASRARAAGRSWICLRICWLSRYSGERNSRLSARPAVRAILGMLSGPNSSAIRMPTKISSSIPIPSISPMSLLCGLDVLCRSAGRAGDRAQHSVHEARRAVRPEFLGQLDGFVDRDAHRRDLGDVELENGDAQHVAIDDGELANWPLRRMPLDQRVEPIALAQHAGDQGAGERLPLRLEACLPQTVPPHP